MGTRAVITFKDENGKHSVYQHWDGDPDNIKTNVMLATGFAWPLPRFEADDFAAAYVAAVKKGGGNIRLTKGPQDHGDLSYSYLVTCKDGKFAIKVKREVYAD
jgi:hypothetical protein